MLDWGKGGVWNTQPQAPWLARSLPQRASPSLPSSLRVPPSLPPCLPRSFAPSLPPCLPCFRSRGTGTQWHAALHVICLHVIRIDLLIYCAGGSST